MLNKADLLFELGTEELPPKSLKSMAQTLVNHVGQALDQLEIGYSAKNFYASPRRLAFLIKDLQAIQKDKLIDKEGPFVDKAYDQNGQPTQAALGFADACGVRFDELSVIDHKKGKRLFYQVKQLGSKIQDLLPGIIEDALKKLPIPKTMRWGNESHQFVRPVHWAVLMLGNEVIPAQFYGCKTANISYGHRFHNPQALVITHATAYVELLKQAYVLVDWQKRKAKIIEQAHTIANRLNAKAVLNDDLIEEVTAIVEWPHALCCDFDMHFLRVPQEALISAMEEHQKCFAIVDQNGKLLNHFITISNIDSSHPQTVIKGNNKVMAARLSDAAFFYDTDVKRPLESYVEKLKVVTFQQQLGSVYDRTLRISNLAYEIAKLIGADALLAKRAGMLSKADLMTDMVYEFTNLQGVIGKYYANAHGEHNDVCQAIEQQYWPKYAGDKLPENKVAQAVALAEKLDTLVGIFGIGQKPTGDKDPFALRRAAIGVLRILKEHQLSISLLSLIKLSIATFNPKLNTQNDLENLLLQFFVDRLKVIYKDEGVTSEIFESVLAVEYSNIADFDARIQALISFKMHPVCERLAQSNKRVVNILEKNNIKTQLNINENLFIETQEKVLFQGLLSVEDKLNKAIFKQAYYDSLIALSALDESLALFFEHVMVMDKDESLKNNRIALLQRLHAMFRKVADLSVL
ncbi:glycine--tRNA ligase subunit beta [Fastidiosibacter lacustris]|uniref:glycine--tRNA ligase subunit beta n=1 Tax=Fastidiosibacter lacustris TaxID=2056695 RepID=UPI000E34E157|nr:glycine--tRNA ligase subunit beta [Fastidiosibacter lacustris]